ncbi:hypothetical protein BGZ81_000876, partial [Podila clonocystis]
TTAEYPPWAETETGGVHVYHAKTVPREENHSLMTQVNKKEDTQVFYVQHTNQNQLNECMENDRSKAHHSHTGSLRGPQYVDPSSFGGYHRHPCAFGESPSKARDPRALSASV